jgi:DNA recombination protein RmuC
LTEVLLAAALAFALAMLIGWLLWGRPLAATTAERDTARGEAADATAEVIRQKEARAGHAVEVVGMQKEIARLETAESERVRIAGTLAALQATLDERDASHARQLESLKANFATLANEALEGAQTQFLKRADARFAEHKTLSETAVKSLLAPVAETLTRYEGELKKVEAARTEAYGGLKEQIAAVMLGQRQVSDEASKLVSALRSSSKTSGSWGEQQLLNTLEMAGLRAGIDFTLQTHVAGESGGRRPDAIINLPGERQLIIDSKCSLKDYLEAAEASSDTDRLAAMKRHAASVRQHARGLSEKAYWNEFGAAADFVVMFIPGENFLSAAMEHDLPLLGWAFEQRILLAGPINLLAIAKTVALVWRQEKLADEAREIGKLGADIHASIATMAEHVGGVGRNLAQAVSSYNSFVGSLEGNVLPKARRFTEMGVEKGKKPVATIGVVDAAVRAVAARELLPVPAALTAPEQDAIE